MERRGASFGLPLVSVPKVPLALLGNFSGHSWIL
jgi:hypothetical protein